MNRSLYALSAVTLVYLVASGALGHAAVNHAVAACGIWVAVVAQSCVLGYWHYAQTHRDVAGALVVAFGPVVVVSAALFAAARLARWARSWRSGRRFSANAARTALAGTAAAGPGRSAPVNIRASRLPHREPGLATTELDLARQLGGVPLLDEPDFPAGAPMAERPRTPGDTHWGELPPLPADVQAHLHAEILAITRVAALDYTAHQETNS